MAKVGEKALARVVKQLRKSARGDLKAREAAAEAWPSFVQAIAAAQEEIRTGQFTGVDRLIGERQRRRSKDADSSGDSISAN